jgi:hypothetical protein
MVPRQEVMAHLQVAPRLTPLAFLHLVSNRITVNNQAMGNKATVNRAILSRRSSLMEVVVVKGMLLHLEDLVTVQLLPCLMELLVLLVAFLAMELLEQLLVMELLERLLGMELLGQLLGMELLGQLLVMARTLSRKGT